MPAFPKLNALLEKELLSHLDLFIAKTICEDYRVEKEALGAFIIYLFLGAKKGHLCAKVTNNTFSPSIFELFEEEEKEFYDLVEKGFEIAQNLSVPFISNDSKTPIVKNGNFFYLSRHFYTEQEILKQSLRLEEDPLIGKNCDKALYEKKIREGIEGSLLTYEQGQALTNALSAPLFFLCGGPGTGKTYTAGKFLLFLFETMQKEKRENFEIALVSPTGKAAVNLAKSLEKNGISIRNFPLLKTKTLHSLLKVKEGENPLLKSGNPITADLLMIDEASMIGSEMFAALLKRVKKGASLFFIGDPNQLPPIESGHLFADFIKVFPDKTAFLTECKRTEQKKLQELAEGINRQDLAVVSTLLKNHSPSLLSAQSDLEVIDYLVEASKAHFKIDAPVHKNAFSSFRILTALRKGPLGSENLNQLFFQELLNLHFDKDELFIPVIVNKNDYTLNLFNGDAGILCLKKKGHRFYPEKIFFNFDGETSEIREIPSTLCPHFEYAFALSIHKSQGSEYEKVVALFPDGSEAFGKELLYTAVTRAKKEVEIISSETTLKKIILQKNERLSGLSSLLLR